MLTNFWRMPIHCTSGLSHQIIWSCYTGRWWVGCCIWYSEEKSGWDSSAPRPLLAVQNVTAHSSATSIPITVLLLLLSELQWSNWCSTVSEVWTQLLWPLCANWSQWIWVMGSSSSAVGEPSAWNSVPPSLRDFSFLWYCCCWSTEQNVFTGLSSFNFTHGSSCTSSSFLPSSTPSLFHSRLKTYLFHKSFPP